MDINGEKFDCSNVVIIATSNEAAACVGEPDAFVDDGSTTNVVHSKAFINRIKPIVFSGLAAEDYRKIFEAQLKNVTLDYKKKYGLEIVLDNASVDAVVQDITNANRGAREVNTYINNLYAALVSYRIKNHIPDRKGNSSGKEPCKSLIVSYNSGAHKFEIR